MNPNYPNPYQQPQAPQYQPQQPNPQPQQPTVYGQAPQQPVANGQPVAPNHFYISQDFKFGRESFSVTDGQNLVCVAKRKIMAVKEHMDIYRDEAATQLIFTIQQERAMAMSKV